MIFNRISIWFRSFHGMLQPVPARIKVYTRARCFVNEHGAHYSLLSLASNRAGAIIDKAFQRVPALRFLPKGDKCNEQ